MPTKLRSKMSIEQKLSADSSALHNALNISTIATLIAPFGYTDTKINEGITMHQNVESLIQKQVKEYGEQYAATEVLNQSRQTADKAYRKSLKIARIVFEHDISAQSALLLKGERKKSYSGWVKETTTFYSTLLNNVDYISQLTPFSLTSEVITNESNLVSEVISNYEKQLKETGEAQASTQERDNAIDEFFSWMTTFYKFVKIALEDHPQLSEQLGILER